VYITPVNTCGERLVYVNREGADEHNNKLSIAFVRIIGCGETLPIEPVDPFADLFQQYPALGRMKISGRISIITPRIAIRNSKPGFRNR
jgi:hypothetical protein